MDLVSYGFHLGPLQQWLRLLRCNFGTDLLSWIPTCLFTVMLGTCT